MWSLISNYPDYVLFYLPRSLGVPAIGLCQSLSILIGSGLVLATAGIYIKDAIDAKR